MACATAVASGLSSAALINLINDGVKGRAGISTAGLRFFGLCLLTLVAKSISQIAILHLTQNAVLNMRVNLGKKLLSTPIKQLQAIGKPGLLAILTRDIDSFIGALQIAPRILTDGIVVLACFGYLAWLSSPVFFMLGGTLIVCFAVFVILQRYPGRQLEKVRAKMDHLYKHFRDLIEGSRELQLNRRRGDLFIERVFTPDAQEFRNTFIRGFSRYTWIGNLGDMLFYVVIGVLLFLVPMWMPITREILASVTLMLLYLVGPISSLINAAPALGQASVALGKIEQLDAKLDTDPKAARPEGADPFERPAEAALELRAVSHQYPGERDDTPFTLGPIDLHVYRGEILFIIGGNGSGKTTLAMLLLGLYMPESGNVLMNGVPVGADNAERYRQHFAAVFADFHLFEHLLGGTQDDFDDRARHYIGKFRLSHRVKVLDGKFSTIDLSSGQKKRLALVLAYLDEKPIYLFDEWAADQDPVFKRVFYTELLPELKARGKTVIVISHDDAYFDCADRVVKLEDGHLCAHSVSAHETLDAAV